MRRWVRRGLTSAQVLEARIPGTDNTVRQHPKEPLGNGTAVHKGNGDVQNGPEALDAAKQETSAQVRQGTVGAYSLCMG